MDSQELQTLSDPEIDFFLLADRAEAVNGKLYLMGGAWDRVFVQDFKQPVTISFALGVLVPWNATNQQHAVQIAIEDIDRRRPVEFSLEAGFVAGRPAWASQGETQRVILAVPSIPVKFPEPGAYQAVAHIAGGRERRVGFSLVAGPVPASPAGR